MADHSSRIAVVTGAGSGIGAWNAVVAVNLHLLVTIRCDLQFEARWTGEERGPRHVTSLIGRSSTLPGAFINKLQGASCTLAGLNS
jgi:hypothetical protein